MYFLLGLFMSMDEKSLNCGHQRISLFIHQMIYEFEEARWNKIDREKPKNSEKKTDLVLLCPGANPGLHGERPATNRLSHGTSMLVGWLAGWLVGHVVINYSMSLLTLP
jgi:hypothetical protein